MPPPVPTISFPSVVPESPIAAVNPPDAPPTTSPAITPIEHPQPRNAKGIARELERKRGFASRLDEALAGTAAVLHDRKLRGARGVIHHIVVATTGVWVISVVLNAGPVELRTVTKRRRAPEQRFYVSGADRTDELTADSWKFDAVEAAARSAGIGSLPVRRVVCLPRADFPDGVSGSPIVEFPVLSGDHLMNLLAQPGDANPATINAMAAHLDAALPPGA